MITVITGCMFAGKTTRLIHELNSQKKDFVVFKPDIDVRYAKNNIVTHDGKSLSCIQVKEPKSILSLSKEYDTIGIDEAQFFENDIIAICQSLSYLNKKVFIACLSTDYLGKPFGSSPNLLAIADEIVKLYAKCNDCGENATFNKRIALNNEKILLGGSNEYVPSCRKCFYKKEKIDFSELFINY